MNPANGSVMRFISLKPLDFLIRMFPFNCVIIYIDSAYSADIYNDDDDPCGNCGI